MHGEPPKDFHARIKEERSQGQETSEDDRFKAEFLAETYTLTRDFLPWYCGGWGGQN